MFQQVVAVEAAAGEEGFSKMTAAAAGVAEVAAGEGEGEVMFLCVLKSG
jgi:hypothetical protein